MKKLYHVTDLARLDLRDIFGYIAQDNIIAARKLRAEFYKSFVMLGNNHYLGHKREDLTQKPLRFWPVGSYLVIYKPDAEPLEIIRILSGYRDVAGVV